MLFTSSRRSYDLQQVQREGAATFWSVVSRYIALGIAHISTGYDHLAFLLALLLLSLGRREIIFVVSGFTLGHSITLSLAALGWVLPNIMLVEALIGFTIALVALENVSAIYTDKKSTLIALIGIATVLILLRVIHGQGVSYLALLGLTLFAGCYVLLIETKDQARKVRPGLTCLFGLVHGFGFASVLMEQGLPKGKLIAALLSFNIGVEIGQLIAVVLMLGIIALTAHITAPSWARHGKSVSSAALLCLGLYWLGSRSLGL